MNKIITQDSKINLTNPDIQILSKDFLSNNKSISYIFEQNVFLSDINMYGTAYFARYFDWQGNARESFIKENIPLTVLSKVKLVTKSASVEYLGPIRLFEKIKICVSFTQVRRISLGMVFVYYNNDMSTILATGYEKILFLTLDDGFAPIPHEILESIKPFIIR